MSKKCTPLFDDADADLAARPWRLDRGGYARTTFNLPKRKLITKMAHRLVLARILGRDPVPDEVCDHVDFNRLNCRRNNLRLATHKTNSQHKKATNATGIRGVCFNKAAGKWQAGVQTGGVSYYCGLHDTPEAAGQAAAKKRKSLGFFGESP